MRITAYQRLLNRLTFEPNTGCWLFTGPLSGHGYASIYDGSRVVRAHRLMFNAEVGEIPANHEIDHLCGVRSCCNPAHLKLATRKDNAMGRRRNQYECKNGHPFTDGNTHFDARGWRSCKTCRNAAIGRHRDGVSKPANGKRTHCLNGHAFTPENTKIISLGRRTCRVCDRQRQSVDQTRF